MHIFSILIDSPVVLINRITPFGANFIIFCAVILPWIVAMWVLVYLLFRPIPRHGIFEPLSDIKKRLIQIFIVCVSAIGALVLSIGLKNYFKILRPEGLNFNLQPLFSLGDYGFPSSHAAVFSAIAAGLFLINRRAGIFAGLLALVIGAARIFAGVHTPLDILGGYLLGTLIAAIVDYFVAK